MANPERKILVPDSDRVEPHPVVVCGAAFKLKDEILLKEDLENGKIYDWRVSRRIGLISGCLIELTLLEYQKKKFTKSS